MTKMLQRLRAAIHGARGAPITAIKPHVMEAVEAQFLIDCELARAVDSLRNEVKRLEAQIPHVTEGARNGE